MRSDLRTGAECRDQRVKSPQAGVASAMVNPAQQIGGPIGTAVFSSLAATQSRTISIPDVETTRAQQQPASVS
jgi:hypothetical protein